MTKREDFTALHVAFIGSAGVPNRYGGFEAFLEHCGPAIARRVSSVTVTCDARMYRDQTPIFQGMRRIFVGVPANGTWSVLHDLLAFLRVFSSNSHILVLGVSGGPWFPLFRLLCSLTEKRLLVNVDGVEWQRSKFSGSRRWLLRVFDQLAQRCSHTVIYDNAALQRFLTPIGASKGRLIAYSGDHVLRLPQLQPEPGTALTVCRIEPENNIDMLIEGALNSPLIRYTVVGNWNNSAYGKALRARHAGNPRLALLDPIYEPQLLAHLRTCSETYLHGHSVGGTNPSLVEMLFYDGRILCYDVPFHRETAGDCAGYFRDAKELAALLAAPITQSVGRDAARTQYSSDHIAQLYVDAMCT